MTRISKALSKAFSDGANHRVSGAESPAAGMPIAGWVPRLRSPARSKEPMAPLALPEARQHRIDPAHAIEAAAAPCQATLAMDAVWPEPAGLTAFEQLPWPALTALLLASSAGPEIHGLAASLCAQAVREPMRGLLFLGATSACGCTTTLLTLARAIHEQRAVHLLLADANLANPTISIEFGPTISGQTPGPESPHAGAAVKSASIVAERLSLLALGQNVNRVEAAREWNLSLNRLLAECQLALIDGGTAAAAIERGPLPQSAIGSFVLVHRAPHGSPEALASTIASALHLECLGLIETFEPRPLAAARPGRSRALATP